VLSCCVDEATILGCYRRAGSNLKLLLEASNH